MKTLTKFKSKELVNKEQANIVGGNQNDENYAQNRGGELALYFAQRLTAQTTQSDCIGKQNYAKGTYQWFFENRSPEVARIFKENYIGNLRSRAFPEGTVACLSI